MPKGEIGRGYVMLIILLLVLVEYYKEVAADGTEVSVFREGDQLN